MSVRLMIVAGLLLTVACGENRQEPAVNVSLQPAFPSLNFEKPLDLKFPADGTNRLFVVEQPGVIRVFSNDPATDTAPIFLDIRDRVDGRGWEMGLLGLAFHPNYRENGYLFVDYTAGNPMRTVISRFQVSPDDPNRADPNSELVILQFDQPFDNHNGGCLMFGPDGNLYIGVGDGGGEGDPQGNGQNRRTLLGKILRIDVDHPGGGRQYGIPEENPLVGNDSSYREEIYAWGLRNPWRFSFDPANGILWAGDVGQDRYEEVDIIDAGKDYGWNIMEGRHCFKPPIGCDTSGLTMPIEEYDHKVGQSITGGVVYRGMVMPELAGAYLYGDFMTGRIWSLRYTEGRGAEVSVLLDSGLNLSSFGVDQQGEVCVCAFDGNLYRIVPTVKK